MANRGGKREGPGQKKGLASIKAEEARKYVVQRIADELEPILTGQIEQAKDIYFETTDDEGQKKIYRRQPDARVAAFLLNQVIGRLKETVEVNVDNTFSLIALNQRAMELQKEDKVSTLPAPSASWEEFKEKYPILKGSE